MPGPILPTVHSNGTSREALLRETRAALVTGRAFVDALLEAAPNARDYYPQGDGVARAARDEHAARVTKARDILDELEAVYRHLMKAGT